MVFEVNAKQIEGFAFKPIGSVPNACDLVQLGHIVIRGMHTQAHTPVVGQ